MPDSAKSPVSHYGNVCALPERLGELGRRMLAEICAACRSAEASVWLLSRDGKQMRCIMNAGPHSTRIEALSVPVDASVVGLVACNGLPASIGPDDYHYPVVDQLLETTTSAMIACPFYVNGAIAGTVSAINPAGGGLFAASDLELLSWKTYLLGLIFNDVAPHEEFP